MSESELRVPCWTPSLSRTIAILAAALIAPGCSATTIFEDDFSGSALGPAWTAIDRQGDTGVDEQGCYQPAQVAVGGGNLVLHSIVQTTSCGDQFNPPTTFPYATGMVQWTSFSFTYGTVHFRAQMAGGRGTWSAVWMLGASCRAASLASGANIGCPWPAPGSEEIDITEIKNSDLTTVWQNLISTARGTLSCTPTTGDVSQGFHDYELVWAPGSLDWKIDGAETCRYTGTIPSSPMFLMVDTALGGGAGPVDPSTLPQTLLVDYVKITQP
jgi:beta-glucanase (GH16 family)